MMKKLFPATVFMVLMATGTAQAASRATITINGTVLDNTCTVESATKTVTLPDILARDVRDDVVGSQLLLSILLKNCGAAAKSVVIGASGTPDSSGTGSVFANSVSQSAGGATGVGLLFYDADSTGDTSLLFKPDGSVTKTRNLQPSADNRLYFKAGYIGTKGTATAGKFSTVVNMTFNYQ